MFGGSSDAMSATPGAERERDDRRRFPRTYVFNRVVALDCLEVNWNGKKYWFLNCVDHGTNYKVLAFLGDRPTSKSVRRAFVRCLVKQLGAPDIIITDPGIEFDGEFQRIVEQLGCLRHAINPESPWENGRCEPHGGLAKEALAESLAIIDIESPEELAELMEATISANHRFDNRGGYDPYQLVFGRLPRLPQSLLSDDA